MVTKPWNLPENRNKLKALRELEAKCKRENKMTQGQYFEIHKLKEQLGMERGIIKHGRSFISRWF